VLILGTFSDVREVDFIIILEAFYGITEFSCGRGTIYCEKDLYIGALGTEDTLSVGLHILNVNLHPTMTLR